MRIASIGIDLGKNTFHLVALGERNKVLVRKKFSRAQLFTYTANLPSSLIGLEACAGAHFVSATLREQGHQVRLIPAQFVKPYRNSNKNDFLDAEAIAEAVTKQNMRFVQIKTQDMELNALVWAHQNRLCNVATRWVATRITKSDTTVVRIAVTPPVRHAPRSVSLRQLTEST
jgi:transposase